MIAPASPASPQPAATAGGIQWVPAGLTVVDGFDQAGLNNPAAIGGAERPDLVPGKSNSPILGAVDPWYDPAAFSLQARGALGNLGRNTLIGPKSVDFDLSLVKNTRIRENVNVEFRAEVFNLLNHPNFALPQQTLFAGVDPGGAGIPNPTAGQIVSTVGTSRQMQFALKFRF